MGELILKHKEEIEIKYFEIIFNQIKKIENLSKNIITNNWILQPDELCDLNSIMDDLEKNVNNM